MAYKKSEKSKDEFSIRLESIRKTSPAKKMMKPAGLLKKKQKITSIIIIIIFFSILFIGVRYFLNTKKQSVKDVAEATSSVPARNIEKPIESFSRVTFFLTSPVKASLAMSSNWEGRYRMIDGGNTVIFKYIGNPDIIADLFSITEFSKEEWEKMPYKDGTVVAEKDNYVLVYKKSSENPYKGPESEKFIKMLNESDAIIKSLKMF